MSEKRRYTIEVQSDDEDESPVDWSQVEAAIKYNCRELDTISAQDVTARVVG